ncbi:signal peptidase I [Pseudoalteromonas sp. SSDWG2]|uniref:signal peptidase I n=1 Tax=Pseudoalteromonas sp. SSDWG2 TaxID=3139391 RepID=UPI003BAD40E1
MTYKFHKIRQFMHTTLKANWGIILTMAFIFSMRSSFADWYTVPSGSMLPTVEIGDQITVDKMAYDAKIPFTDHTVARLAEPQRGDIIVFESQAADNRLLKRIVAVPGDTISMSNERVFINGEPLKYVIKSTSDDAFLLHEQLGDINHLVRIDKTRSAHLANLHTVTIPADHYFVMGDNRRNSADSRVYGLVPRSEIKGKAHWVAFSLDYDNYYLPKGNRFAHNLYQ